MKFPNGRELLVADLRKSGRMTVLCGWLAARTRRLPADSVAPLNGFVLWFALPAMLLRFVAQTPVDTIVDPRVALGYAACGLIAYTLAALVLRCRARSNWIDTGYGALAAAWPNWGYMGFGLIPALFGDRSLATMIAAGIMDLLVLMPVALLVASRQHATGGLGALTAGLKAVVRNPLFIAIASGLALSLLHVVGSGTGSRHPGRGHRDGCTAGGRHGVPICGAQ